jgi:hypothetical protein
VESLFRASSLNVSQDWKTVKHNISACLTVSIWFQQSINVCQNAGERFTVHFLATTYRRRKQSVKRDQGENIWNETIMVHSNVYKY